MMRPQELVKYGIEVRAMATDYDTPRKTDEELHEESLEELKANVSMLNPARSMLMKQKLLKV